MYPLRISQSFIKDHHYDLLYLTKGSNKHYCFISNLSALVRSQKKPNGGDKLHICRSCLFHFRKAEQLERHYLTCCRFQPVKPQLPIQNVNDFISFNSRKFKMLQYVPYVIYSDFETCLTPILLNGSSNTVDTHLHEPTSFCYYIVSRNSLDDTKYEPIIYRGPNAAKVFWKSMHKEAQNISNKIKSSSQPMIIDLEEEMQLRNTPNPICHLCKKRILEKEDLVLDHDHLSKNLRPPGMNPSNVRGVAHSKCNLAFSIPQFLPVILHNGSKYDFRLILSECAADEEMSLFENIKKKKNKKNIIKKNKKINGGKKRQVNRVRNAFIDDQAKDDDDDDGLYYEESDISDTESINDFINDESESEGNVEESDDDDESVIGGIQDRTERKRRREFGSSDEEEDDADTDEYYSESSNIKIVSDEVIGEKQSATRINVLARSAEDFISFEKYITFDLRLRFLDSYRFLSDSLSHLASILEKSKMKHVRKFYNTDEQFEIACRKGVFPYEYISHPSKYDDSCLPPIESFYSSLTGQSISKKKSTILHSLCFKY